MRACIISSNASLILSAEIDPAFSCSSSTVSSCRSRAAHPRVNEPAAAACVITLTTTVASIQGANRNIQGISSSSGTENLSQNELRCAGGGRPAAPATVRNHRPASGSRASVERIVGSGSEPTYLPLTNTSWAGLLLYVFGAASALDAMATARPIASVVLVNMGVSPAGWLVTPHPVCASI